jgi:hypothetical protein
MDLLERIKGKTPEKVLYHEWVSDEYSSLDWIQLIFQDKTGICFSLGNSEETLEVLDGFNPKSEQMRLNEMFDAGKVTIRSTDCSDTRKWKNYTGEKITGYVIEYTAEGKQKSVTLFSGSKKIQICAGQDNLEVKVLAK